MPAAKRDRTELSVVVYLAFLGVLMAFGIDVSLPAFDELRAEFDLDARGVSVGIVGTLYILGTATGQLVYGAASDRFGRRNVMLVGIALYALGALGRNGRTRPRRPIARWPSRGCRACRRCRR